VGIILDLGTYVTIAHRGRKEDSGRRKRVLEKFQEDCGERNLCQPATERAPGLRREVQKRWPQKSELGKAMKKT